MLTVDVFITWLFDSALEIENVENTEFLFFKGGLFKIQEKVVYCERWILYY